MEEYDSMLKELNMLKEKYEYKQYIAQEVQTENRVKNKHVQTAPVTLSQPTLDSKKRRESVMSKQKKKKELA